MTNALTLERPGELVAPEPGLTPAEMIARATAMIPTLRARQAQTEAAGRLLDETNADFLRAGFYRVLQPRRFGGYEFDLATYARLMMEIGRGCPSSGWVLALTAGHPITLADFPERAQAEAYGATGDYLCPSVGSPIPVTREGAFLRLNGGWDYASGCDVATHVMVSGLVPEADGSVNARLILVDRSQIEIVDNWHMIGMQGTGSRRVVAKDVLVPDYRTAPMAVWSEATGAPVHANPMYNGRKGSYFALELGAVIVGTARGALDLYEEICRTKAMRFSPREKLFESAEFQRYFGVSQAQVDTAEAALLQAMEIYTEACRSGQSGGDFSEETDRRILAIGQQAAQLAWAAMETIFTTAGTTAGAVDSMLARYYRDAAVQKTHFVQQVSRTAVNAARLHFGLPALLPF